MLQTLGIPAVSPANPRAESAFSFAMLVLGVTAAIVSVALTIRCYMPCPWLDGWGVLAELGRGAKPWSWGWLWSQHNEHRIALVRLLSWLDWAAFGGKNVSLFLEIYLVQMLQLAAICYVLERCTDFPKSLKRMLEGLFAFCLFHPYQAQNLTWAFQIAFILPFAIGTIALLGVAFIEKIPARWRGLLMLGIGLAPMFAAMTLASGLLVGPAAIGLAFLKRISRRELVMLIALSLTSFVFYFWGYRSPSGHPSPFEALRHPGDVDRYVLLVLDTSWQVFSMAGISIIFLGCSVAAALHRRERVSNFEWFCFAECGLMLAAASSIACGRLQYGVAQAAESRYQTPAMIYWAALFSLALIAVWRWQPARIGLLQMGIVLIALYSLLSLRPVWSGFIAQADGNAQACASVMRGKYGPSAVKQLDLFADDPGEVGRAAALLRERWGR